MECQLGTQQNHPKIVPGGWVVILWTVEVGLTQICPWTTEFSLTRDVGRPVAGGRLWGEGRLSVTMGRTLRLFLTQQAQARFSIQVGAGEFVCGEREADRARTPPESPLKLQGNFVKSLLFLENPNSGWTLPRRQGSNLPF